MTPDEQRMLSELADKIAKTPPPPKDADAEDFIRSRIGNRPDALYLMTQTVLIQNMALEQAQRQLQAQQQAGRQGGSGSFLRGGGGQYAPSASSQQQYAPPPPQYAAAPSGQPSFLRGAAQTAAGVAAGALAFEGIRSLFEHPGYGGGGLGSGFSGGYGGFGGGPSEETVVNNYYDDDRSNAAAGDTGDLNLQDDRDSFASSGDDFASNDSGFDSGDGGSDSGGGDDFS